MSESKTEIMSLMKTQVDEELAILNMAGVKGIGLGYKEKGGKVLDNLCFSVYVEQKVSPGVLKDYGLNLIPRQVAGIYTDIIETGTIKAIDTTPQVTLAQRKGKFRPAPGGVSVGHKDVTAGTLGCVVIKDGYRMILSNNHVLANSSSSTNGNAKVGDAIYQPGVYDGGKITSGGQIGTLHSFEPLVLGGGGSDCPVALGFQGFGNAVAKMINSRYEFSASKNMRRTLRAKEFSASYNVIDAALAKPFNQSDLSAKILEIGFPEGVDYDIKLGDTVIKSGRTTGLTSGTIRTVNLTTKVSYGNDGEGLFKGQIGTADMSNGGDSGSAGVMSDSHKIFGLLYAGSDATETSTGSTVFCPIEDVINKQKITRVATSD